MVIFAAFELLFNFVFQSQQKKAAFLVLLMCYQRYDSTLFYYASHTQQKLVSRWGVGKQITIKYDYITLQ